ncbi:hypothetical protein [Citrobacter phage Ci1]|nr:hypothetical protein [Citrobacter phage Ci1]
MYLLHVIKKTCLILFFYILFMYFGATASVFLMP